MRHPFRGFVAALLCLIAVAAAAQDEAPDTVANPSLLPKAILAMRGEQGSTTQLQIVFDRTRDGETIAPLTVWIGADYFALVDGPRVTITDLRLRRRLIVDRQAGTLVNLSLYGDVMLRRIELVRRLGIARALAREEAKNKRGPAPPESLDRFWIESELGLPSPGKGPSKVVDLQQDGNAYRYFHAGQDVVTLVPSDTPIPARVQHSWEAFIRHTLPLHPDIARGLADDRLVPARLDYISEANGKAETITLNLRHATVASADFPLPADLSLLLLPTGENDPEVALMRQVLPHMFEAVANRAPDRTGQIAAFRTAIDGDFKRGRKFEATLRLAELALRWGKSAAACKSGEDAGPCQSKQQIDRMLRDDPRSMAMFEAISTQNSEPAHALEILRKLDRGDTDSGYVIDIFLARLLSESGDRGAAARAFAAAFAGDPFIPSLYRDLGDHFTLVSRLDLAWLCYDLGRALPNRRLPDALSGIDTIEQDLVKAYPEMF
ncbi:MAG TPA: hypothetical protein VH020_02265 [Stellaceae bacterium]|nr:hypothetical protein [Stellaceae bacterium]